MKKVLIHIGASKLQENTLRWAKEAGLYVVATDIDANASSKDIADEFFNISGTDVASLLALSKKLNYLYDVVGVYCNSDFGLEAASEINSKLSLKGCLPKSVKLSLNKLQAKKLMFRKGVPVPLSFTVIEDSKYENLIFPVIVKPADSCGSQGVSFIKQAQDVKKAIDHAYKYSESVMIEEYVDGDGVDTIGIMYDGVLYPYGIGSRVFSHLPYCFPVHGCSPLEMIDSEVRLAYSITEKAALALGIKNGPVKADLLYKNGRFTLIELTPRFHGDVFTSKLIFYSTNVSAVQELFNSMISKSLPKKSHIRNNGKIILWKALFPLIEDIDFENIFNELRERYDLLDVFINKNPLKVVNMHIDNSTSAGFFWVAFNSHQELKDFLSYFKHKYEGQFL